MDSAFRTVVDRYHARMQREREEQQHGNMTEMMQRRDQYLLAVGEEVARFLHSLIIARGAKRIIELGTSYGYSTLFLADAARRTGGKLTTFEIAADKQVYAQSQIEEAGLGDHVDWRLGDAVSQLENLDGPIDFVLLDLWKELYIPCLEAFFPKLTQNAIIAADNMLQPTMYRAEAKLYRDAVKAKTGIQSLLLPIGQGVELSCLWRDEGAT